MLMCFCEEPMISEDQDVNIFATRCGHVFHYSCLTQWLEKSLSCPQCRSHVEESELLRLYPAFSGESPHGEADDVLGSCLDRMERISAKCREKDNVIAKLKTDAEKTKAFGQENGLNSLLQMLNGLKDMATIIYKTVDVQQDELTQPRPESPDAAAAIMQPRPESPNAAAAIIQPRPESPDAAPAISQPRPESPNAAAAIIQPRPESPNAAAAIIQPRPESPDAAPAIIQPRLESPDAGAAIILPRAESLDADDVNHLSSETADTDAVIQLRTESPDDATMSQLRMEWSNVEENVTQNSNPSSMSPDDVQRAAIKSSLKTLESMLVRILEIKNSNRENL